MTKIEALNVLPVTDWSCSGGECEYVLTNNTEKIRTHLLSAGFTEDEIKEASDGTDADIDLSCLAFRFTDADWWMREEGFGLETEIRHD